MNKFFEALTRWLPYIVFGISVLASITDLIVSEVQNARGTEEFVNRGFGYGCFMLDIIDLTLLSLNALLPRSKWYVPITIPSQFMASLVIL